MTDVPMELIIIVIILLIVIPIMVAALATYVADQQFMALQQQSSNIANSVVAAYDGGSNTTITLSVSIGNQGSIYIGAPLFVGSTENPNATYVTFEMNGQRYLDQFSNGATLIFATNFTCKAGLPLTRPLTLGSGGYTVAFTKIATGTPICGTPSTYPETFVEVALLP